MLCFVYCTLVYFRTFSPFLIVVSSSSSSSKYDPEILKAEIATTKSRVRFLKWSLWFLSVGSDSNTYNS